MASSFLPSTQDMWNSALNSTPTALLSSRASPAAIELHQHDHQHSSGNNTAANSHLDASASPISADVYAYGLGTTEALATAADAATRRTPSPASAASSGMPCSITGSCSTPLRRSRPAPPQLQQQQQHVCAASAVGETSLSLSHSDSRPWRRSTATPRRAGQPHLPISASSPPSTTLRDVGPCASVGSHVSVDDSRKPRPRQATRASALRGSHAGAAATMATTTTIDGHVSPSFENLDCISPQLLSPFINNSLPNTTNGSSVYHHASGLFSGHDGRGDANECSGSSAAVSGGVRAVSSRYISNASSRGLAQTSIQRGRGGDSYLLFPTSSSGAATPTPGLPSPHAALNASPPAADADDSSSPAVVADRNTTAKARSPTSPSGSPHYYCLRLFPSVSSSPTPVVAPPKSTTATAVAAATTTEQTRSERVGSPRAEDAEAREYSASQPSRPLSLSSRSGGAASSASASPLPASHSTTSRDPAEASSIVNMVDLLPITEKSTTTSSAASGLRRNGKAGQVAKAEHSASSTRSRDGGLSSSSPQISKNVRSTASGSVSQAAVVPPTHPVCPPTTRRHLRKHDGPPLSASSASPFTTATTTMFGGRVAPLTTFTTNASVVSRTSLPTVGAAERHRYDTSLNENSQLSGLGDGHGSQRVSSGGKPNPATRSQQGVAVQRARISSAVRLNLQCFQPTSPSHQQEKQRQQQQPPQQQQSTPSLSSISTRGGVSATRVQPRSAQPPPQSDPSLITTSSSQGLGSSDALAEHSTDTISSPAASPPKGRRATAKPSEAAAVHSHAIRRFVLRRAAPRVAPPRMNLAAKTACAAAPVCPEERVRDETHAAAAAVEEAVVEVEEKKQQQQQCTHTGDAEATEASPALSHLTRSNAGKSEEGPSLTRASHSPAARPLLRPQLTPAPPNTTTTAANSFGTSVSLQSAVSTASTKSGSKAVVTKWRLKSRALVRSKLQQQQPQQQQPFDSVNASVTSSFSSAIPQRQTQGPAPSLPSLSLSLSQQSQPAIRVRRHPSRSLTSASMTGGSTSALAPGTAEVRLSLSTSQQQQQERQHQLVTPRPRDTSLQASPSPIIAYLNGSGAGDAVVRVTPVSTRGGGGGGGGAALRAARPRYPALFRRPMRALVLPQQRLQQQSDLSGTVLGEASFKTNTPHCVDKAAMPAQAATSAAVTAISSSPVLHRSNENAVVAAAAVAAAAADDAADPSRQSHPLNTVAETSLSLTTVVITGKGCGPARNTASVEAACVLSATLSSATIMNSTPSALLQMHSNSTQQGQSIPHVADGEVEENAASMTVLESSKATVLHVGSPHAEDAFSAEKRSHTRQTATASSIDEVVTCVPSSMPSKHSLDDGRSSVVQNHANGQQQPLSSNPSGSMRTSEEKGVLGETKKGDVVTDRPTTPGCIRAMPPVEDRALKNALEAKVTEVQVARPEAAASANAVAAASEGVAASSTVSSSLARHRKTIVVSLRDESQERVHAAHTPADAESAAKAAVSSGVPPTAMVDCRTSGDKGVDRAGVCATNASPLSPPRQRNGLNSDPFLCAAVPSINEDKWWGNEAIVDEDGAAAACAVQPENSDVACAPAEVTCVSPIPSASADASKPTSPISAFSLTATATTTAVSNNEASGASAAVAVAAAAATQTATASIADSVHPTPPRHNDVPAFRRVGEDEAAAAAAAAAAAVGLLKASLTPSHPLTRSATATMTATNSTFSTPAPTDTITHSADSLRPPLPPHPLTTTVTNVAVVTETPVATVCYRRSALYSFFASGRSATAAAAGNGHGGAAGLARTTVASSFYSSFDRSCLRADTAAPVAAAAAAAASTVALTRDPSSSELVGATASLNGRGASVRSSSPMPRITTQLFTYGSANAMEEAGAASYRTPLLVVRASGAVLPAAPISFHARLPSSPASSPTNPTAPAVEDCVMGVKSADSSFPLAAMEKTAFARFKPQHYQQQQLGTTPNTVTFPPASTCLSTAQLTAASTMALLAVAAIRLPPSAQHPLAKRRWSSVVAQDAVAGLSRRPSAFQALSVAPSARKTINAEGDGRETNASSDTAPPPPLLPTLDQNGMGQLWKKVCATTPKSVDRHRRSTLRPSTSDDAPPHPHDCGDIVRSNPVAEDAAPNIAGSTVGHQRRSFLQRRSQQQQQQQQQQQVSSGSEPSGLPDFAGPRRSSRRSPLWSTHRTPTGTARDRESQRLGSWRGDTSDPTSSGGSGTAGNNASRDATHLSFPSIAALMLSDDSDDEDDNTRFSDGLVFMECDQDIEEVLRARAEVMRRTGRRPSESRLPVRRASAHFSSEVAARPCLQTTSTLVKRTRDRRRRTHASSDGPSSDIRAAGEEADDEADEENGTTEEAAGKMSTTPTMRREGGGGVGIVSQLRRAHPSVNRCAGPCVAGAGDVAGDAPTRRYRWHSPTLSLQSALLLSSDGGSESGDSAETLTSHSRGKVGDGDGDDDGGRSSAGAASAVVGEEEKVRTAGGVGARSATQFRSTGPTHSAHTPVTVYYTQAKGRSQRGEEASATMHLAQQFRRQRVWPSILLSATDSGNSEAVSAPPDGLLKKAEAPAVIPTTTTAAAAVAGRDSDAPCRVALPPSIQSPIAEPEDGGSSPELSMCGAAKHRPAPLALDTLNLPDSAATAAARAAGDALSPTTTTTVNSPVAGTQTAAPTPFTLQPSAPTPKRTIDWRPTSTAATTAAAVTAAVAGRENTSSPTAPRWPTTAPTQEAKEADEGGAPRKLQGTSALRQRSVLSESLTKLDADEAAALAATVLAADHQHHQHHQQHQRLEGASRDAVTNISFVYHPLTLNELARDYASPLASNVVSRSAFTFRSGFISALGSNGDNRFEEAQNAVVMIDPPGSGSGRNASTSQRGGGGDWDPLDGHVRDPEAPHVTTTEMDDPLVPPEVPTTQVRPSRQAASGPGSFTVLAAPPVHTVTSPGPPTSTVTTPVKASDGSDVGDDGGADKSELNEVSTTRKQSNSVVSEALAERRGSGTNATLQPTSPLAFDASADAATREDEDDHASTVKSNGSFCDDSTPHLHPRLSPYPTGATAAASLLPLPSAAADRASPSAGPGILIPTRKWPGSSVMTTPTPAPYVISVVSDGARCVSGGGGAGAGGGSGSAALPLTLDAVDVESASSPAANDTYARRRASRHSRTSFTALPEAAGPTDASTHMSPHPPSTPSPQQQQQQQQQQQSSLSALCTAPSVRRSSVMIALKDSGSGRGGDGEGDDAAKPVSCMSPDSLYPQPHPLLLSPQQQPQQQQTPAASHRQRVSFCDDLAGQDSMALPPRTMGEGSASMTSPTSSIFGRPAQPGITSVSPVTSPSGGSVLALPPALHSHAQPPLLAHPSRVLDSPRGRGGDSSSVVAAIGLDVNDEGRRDNLQEREAPTVSPHRPQWTRSHPLPPALQQLQQQRLQQQKQQPEASEQPHHQHAHALIHHVSQDQAGSPRCNSRSGSSMRRGSGDGETGGVVRGNGTSLSNGPEPALSPAAAILRAHMLLQSTTKASPLASDSHMALISVAEAGESLGAEKSVTRHHTPFASRRSVVPGSSGISSRGGGAARSSTYDWAGSMVGSAMTVGSSSLLSSPTYSDLG